MGIYSNTSRSANVISDEASKIYKLTREILTKIQRGDPAVAIALDRFIVQTLASRLVFANKEVAGMRR